MRADLHVHSDYSDGSESVHRILQKAAAQAVTHLSFVDHDSTDGLIEKQALGESFGIHVIPGIEISAYDFKRDRKVHVLGYDYQTPAKHIELLCQVVQRRRQHHTLWQMEQINKRGYDLDKQAIMKSAKPSPIIYKQHVMSHLTEAEFASSDYQSLYQQLFKGSGPASGDITYVNAVDAVRAIVADGGLAVIAHPGQLDSYELIPELIEVGLGGIERNHSDHTEEDHRKVEELADKYSLIMTGGTDYHAQFGMPIAIGSLPSPSLPIQKKRSKPIVEGM
ncbi:PHP domain-containing protein [Shouchella shacheensis]|uniref:PHP domain-containing protein n=1 Tax=Shouchella shacheensis TaxID=1649580 RepID=UPI00073FF709|nr:PHP domain-containing protein [Shouchella shacheensis]